jgi:hypothetical protein
MLATHLVILAEPEFRPSPSATMYHFGPETQHKCTRAECGQIAVTFSGEIVQCKDAKHRRRFNYTKLPGEMDIKVLCNPLTTPTPALSLVIIPDAHHCGMDFARAQRHEDSDWSLGDLRVARASIVFGQTGDLLVRASTAFGHMGGLLSARTSIAPHHMVDDNMDPGWDSFRRTGKEIISAHETNRAERRRVFVERGPPLRALLADDERQRLMIDNDLREHEQGRHSESNIACRWLRCMAPC